MLKRRLANMLAVAILFFVFVLSYRSFIAPIYDYYGMGWRNPPLYMLALSLFMNMLIAFIVRPDFTQTSQLFLCIQFLVVFLPASIVCLNVTLPVIAMSDALTLVIAMFFGLLIQVALNPRKLRSTRISPGPRTKKVVRMVFFGMFVFACIVLLSALYSLGSIFSISNLSAMYSNLAAMYDQRDLLDEKGVGWFMRYGISWLVMFILPSLLVAALELRGFRRFFLLGFCMLGYFVLFGITATKATLFAPIIVLTLRHALKPSRASYIQKLALTFSFLLAIPLVGMIFENLENFMVLYVAIVNFRIFSVPHVLYVQYLDFFSNHSYTYGSHVSVISWFVPYPFDKQTFLLIGEYFYPGSNMTANAGTWAQDGIASFGIAGILGVSVVFAAIMRVLDNATEGHDPRKIGAALSMLSFFVSNASIFTALLTGGLLIVIVLFLFVQASTMQRGGKSIK